MEAAAKELRDRTILEIVGIFLKILCQLELYDALVVSSSKSREQGSRHDPSQLSRQLRSTQEHEDINTTRI